MPEIRLEHVTKRWGKFYAVDDLSMVIEDNAFVTLLGPSGCGKTTTLRMIAGLETPTSGRITIGDKVVFDSALGINIPASKRKVGFLFQNYALWPNMTVYDNIAFGLKIRKTPKAERKQKVLDAARMLGIEHLLKYPLGQLSGGERQRISIARAILKNSPILLLDEATASLDIENELAVKQAIANLLKEKKTVVMIAHTLSIVKNADQILVVADGKIAEAGTHEELLAKNGKYAAMWQAEQKISA